MSDLQLEMCRRLLASKRRVTATPVLATPALTAPFPRRYRRFLASKQAKQALNGGKQTMVLASIGSLRKLCNHPLLVMDKGTPDRGFESCVDLPGLDADGPEPAPTGIMMRRTIARGSANDPRNKSRAEPATAVIGMASAAPTLIDRADACTDVKSPRRRPTQVRPDMPRARRRQR